MLSCHQPVIDGVIRLRLYKKEFRDCSDTHVYENYDETMMLVLVNEISKTMRPAWDQRVRAGTKAAQVSNCCWQALRICDSLLIFTSYCSTRSVCLEPHFQSGGPQVRKKLLSRRSGYENSGAVLSTQVNGVFLQLCPHLATAYPRLAALALPKPSVLRNKKRRV